MSKGCDNYHETHLNKIKSFNMLPKLPRCKREDYAADGYDDALEVDADLPIQAPIPPQGDPAVA